MEISREFKVLRAALAICKAHDAYLGSGSLHILIEDSNYEGDLSGHRHQVETDYAAGLSSPTDYMIALECLDALDPLSDDERLGAEWLWLRVLRWDSWNVYQEPE